MPFLKAHYFFFFPSRENEPLVRGWFGFTLIRGVETAAVGLRCFLEWSALVSEKTLQGPDTLLCHKCSVLLQIHLLLSSSEIITLELSLSILST